jgi:hydroxymethylglutaryl-CoA synthase
MDSPFPTVDGKLSMNCYFEALDYSFERYCKNFQRITGQSFDLDNSAQFILFHSPFVKLVRKSYARMYFNEWKKGNLSSVPPFDNVDTKFRDITVEESYNHNEMFKVFTDLTNERQKKIQIF